MKYALHITHSIRPYDLRLLIAEAKKIDAELLLLETDERYTFNHTDEALFLAWPQASFTALFRWVALKNYLAVNLPVEINRIRQVPVYDANDSTRELCRVTINVTLIWGDGTKCTDED